VGVEYVEGIRAERKLQVGADADGDAEPALPRHRDRRAERDDAFERLPLCSEAPQRAPPATQVDCPVGRRKDDHFVAAAAKLLRRGLDVLVDRMRL
jgi:hypothetical protein